MGTNNLEVVVIYLVLLLIFFVSPRPGGGFGFFQELCKCLAWLGGKSLDKNGRAAVTARPLMIIPVAVALPLPPLGAAPYGHGTSTDQFFQPQWPEQFQEGIHLDWISGGLDGVGFGCDIDDLGAEDIDYS